MRNTARKLMPEQGGHDGQTKEKKSVKAAKVTDEGSSANAIKAESYHTGLGRF
jgi:hypothetical protein